MSRQSKLKKEYQVKCPFCAGTMVKDSFWRQLGENQRECHEVLICWNCRVFINTVIHGEGRYFSDHVEMVPKKKKS